MVRIKHQIKSVGYFWTDSWFFKLLLSFTGNLMSSTFYRRVRIWISRKGLKIYVFVNSPIWIWPKKSKEILIAEQFEAELLLVPQCQSFYIFPRQLNFIMAFGFFERSVTCLNLSPFEKGRFKSVRIKQIEFLFSYKYYSLSSYMNKVIGQLFLQCSSIFYQSEWHTPNSLFTG